MQNGHVESGFEFRYLLDFEDKMYLFANLFAKSLWMKGFKI